MAKYLDQNGSKRLVDNVKTSHGALNTKINSEMVARQNFAADVTDSISALDGKIDAMAADCVQSIAVDGSTLSITSGAGTTDTYLIQDTTYDLATTVNAGLMSASDKAKLDGLGGSTSSTSNKFTEQVTLSGGFVSKSVESDLRHATVNSGNSSIKVSSSSINANSASISAYNATIDARNTSIDAGTGAYRATIGGNPEFSGKPTFTGKPTLSGGFNASSASSDLSYATINVYNSSIRATNSSIDATGASIDTGGTISSKPSATISGNPIFSGNPTLSGNPTFTGKPTLSGGFVSKSIASDLSYATINASNSSINASNATVTGAIAGNPTLSGNPTFTGKPVLSGGFNASNTSSDLSGSTINARRASINAGYASINAADSSINATNATVAGNMTFSGNPVFAGAPNFSGNMTLSGDTQFTGNPKFTGKPTLSGGFNARSASIDATNSSITVFGSEIDANLSRIDMSNSKTNAWSASIDATNATISGSPTFTGTPTLSGYTTFTGKPQFNDGFSARSVSSDLTYATIDATNATINGGLTFTGQPTLSAGFTSSYRPSDLRYATIDAEGSKIGAWGASINATNATISGSPTITGTAWFTGNAIFGNGFNAGSVQSYFGDATIYANGANVNERNATIDATSAKITLSGASIDAASAAVKVKGNLTFTDNYSNIGGKLIFTDKLELRDGFTANSTSSDLSYATINAAQSTISGNLTFDGYPTLTGFYLRSNSSFVTTGLLYLNTDNDKPRLLLHVGNSSYVIFDAGSG